MVFCRDTGSINSLKISIYKKNNANGSSKSALLAGITVTTTVNTPATTISAGFTMKMMSGDDVTTNVPPLSTNDNNKIIDYNDNVLIQKLCSALMHVATMQQKRQEVDDVTIKTDHARRSTATVVTRRFKSQRKSIEKKFPSPPPETGNYGDFSDTCTEKLKKFHHQNPIMAQELSRMDYRTTVDPLENELDDGDVKEKHDEDVDQ